MYLFIFESIGTSELLLIGVIALIVFGPRKLPEMAKMIGKTMADFKKTTSEFKTTWEREAEFYKEENIIDTRVVPAHGMKSTAGENSSSGNSVERIKLNSPEIKELDEENAKKLFSGIKEQETRELKADNHSTENVGKRDWL